MNQNQIINYSLVSSSEDQSYYVFRVTIPSSFVYRDIMFRTHNMRNNMNIAGFRKGCAPLDLVEIRCGEDIKKNLFAQYCQYAIQLIMSDEKYKNIELSSIWAMDLNEHDFIVYITLSKDKLDHEKSNIFAIIEQDKDNFLKSKTQTI